MGLLERCTEENFVWSNAYADVYHYTDEGGEKKGILEVQIPHKPEREAVLAAKYSLSPESRADYYMHLAHGIQHQYEISESLKRAEIASILTFSNVERITDQQGVTHICFETVPMTPILGSIIQEKTPAITLINVFLRLAVVLRDFAGLTPAFSHRGLDINEIYVTEENKILVGGFFYSSYEGNPNPVPGYLPEHPANLTKNLLEGKTGSAGDDLAMLSCMAWNLFSGLPADEQLPEPPYIFPEYATEELAQVLAMGRDGKAKDVKDINAFRKKLNECRKQVAQNPQASKWVVPCPRKREPHYCISIIET